MPISDCARTCWIAAAALGLLVWAVTSGVGPMHWSEGLFLALIAAGILGPALIWADCSGVAAMDATVWQPEVPHDLPDPGAPGVKQGQPDPVAKAAVVDDVAMTTVKKAEGNLASETDDLKRIKGIGPKLEAVLQGAGITRIAQIAAWDEADTNRFAAVLGRLGNRIRSDDWIGQARRLQLAGKGGDA